MLIFDGVICDEHTYLAAREDSYTKSHALKTAAELKTRTDIAQLTAGSPLLRESVYKSCIVRTTVFGLILSAKYCAPVLLFIKVFI